ncbi:hypothetical protein [Psychromonas arctica]|uniref:hypothetical protein n=1 Tax=Psychromonas arctica TaxID=168275 RepID=UPI002FCFDAB7
MRMIATECDDKHSLEICVGSGHADFTVNFILNKQDFDVIEKDEERAAFLHAALHHSFQHRETNLNNKEQRHFLDVILHGEKSVVESFLTQMDHGDANGAISNMIRITCKREQSRMRQGHWFN